MLLDKDTPDSKKNHYRLYIWTENRKYYGQEFPTKEEAIKERERLIG